MPAPIDVTTFLAELDHPRKPAILALRDVVRGADPRITEEIKWSAPSFRAPDPFATFQLRSKDGVQLVLHFGAKKRSAPVDRSAVADPAGLLTWLGDDRASLVVRDTADVAEKQAAIAEMIREWLRHA